MYLMLTSGAERSSTHTHIVSVTFGETGWRQLDLYEITNIILHSIYIFFTDIYIYTHVQLIYTCVVYISDCFPHHYNEDKYASWLLKSPIIRLLFHSLFMLNNNKLHLTESLRGESADLLHKRPIMWKFHMLWRHHVSVFLELFVIVA